MNDRVYIHEIIDIIGPNRANYMHHMAANFSPRAQVERQQLCYGVWGIVNSTMAGWPKVLNIWEENGFDGLATSWRHELSHPGLQDPFLATWWAKAAEYRSGGTSRILAPAAWTRTIEELCREGATGEAYAHEVVRVPRGTAPDYLEAARQEATGPYGDFGLELVGAWETLMVDASECILLWTIPSFERWADFERLRHEHDGLVGWRERSRSMSTSSQRVLLVDSPLCPFRTHRQPREEDQTDWEG